MTMDAAIQETDMQLQNPLAKVEPLAVVPTTTRARIMAEALKEDTEQRALLMQYVKRHMVDGVDFGTIPGTQKPTLLKPGAEKLTDLFRCTPGFELIEKLEDWEKGLFHYTFRVRITSRDANTVLAEGYGSANSREGRYRWRNANRKCPQCGKETIFVSKNPGEGFYCWKKKGGCGVTFDSSDDRLTSQSEGKVENDDIFTLVNTILKMAKKRALVDGAIALARCSDIFTQDVEDLADNAGPAADAPPTRQSEKKKAQTTVNAARANQIWEGARSIGVTRKGFPAWVEKVLGTAKHSTEWTAQDMEHLEAELKVPKDINF